MRIAIRAPNWLGDAVMSLPALAGLEATFPDAEIDVYARSSVAEIYERFPGSPHRRVIAIPGGRGRLSLFRRIVPELRGRRAELGIIFPPSFSSALQFVLGGVRTRIGHRGQGRTLLLGGGPRPSPRGVRHLSEEYRRLVDAAAESVGAPATRSAGSRVLRTDPSERERVEALLDRSRPWIALAPGAVYGPTKRWPPASYAELANRLHEEGNAIVLTGGEDDRPACDAVESEAGVPVLNLAGKTSVGEAIALFASVRLVVSNDSGAMHLAAASGAPVVAIFGSTNPDWTRPLGDRIHIVRRDEPCAPCYRSTCEIGIVCLTRISVQEVLDACRSGLAGPAGVTASGEFPVAHGSGERPPATRRAAFLDRDGTINEEVSFLSRPEDLVLVPGSAGAIARLNREGIPVIVITNQSGVARGYFDLDAVARVNAELRRRLEHEGARIDAFYVCPHHPDFTGPCSCRKPLPGQLRNAAAEHDLDLARSLVVGDRMSDVGSGLAVGARTALVLTGYGRESAQALAPGSGPAPDRIVPDLAAAVDWFLGEDRGTDQGAPLVPPDQRRKPT